MKRILTTGDVAKACKISATTVRRWFDSEKLRGYRIPGTLNRRIPREHLIRFLKELGDPIPSELEEIKVLVVGVDEYDEVLDEFRIDYDFEAIIVRDARVYNRSAPLRRVFLVMSYFK